MREKGEQKSCEETRQETSNRSFPGFPRAYAGIQFAFTEKTASIKRSGVSRKDYGEDKKNPGISISPLFESHEQGEGEANIKDPKSNLPSLFCRARSFRRMKKEIETQNAHHPERKKAGKDR